MGLDNIQQNDVELNNIHQNDIGLSNIQQNKKHDRSAFNEMTISIQNNDTFESSAQSVKLV